MKTFFYTILFILGTVSMPTSLLAQCNINNLSGGGFAGGSEIMMGQTFKPSCNGSLTAISFISEIDPNGLSATVNIRAFNTSSPSCTGTILATKNITVVGSSGGSTNNVVFTTPVSVTQNTTYLLEIVCSAAYDFFVAANNYTGGICYYSRAGNLCQSTTALDMSFSATIGAALPIELISFTGKNEKAQNLLFWKTATETNNKGFDIETSKDGVNFQTLEFVKGRGTTSETQNYTFTHRLAANQSGILYYRLKQMDFDGKFEYSKTIAVRSEGKQNSVVVYPNPSNGLYTISLDEKAEIEQISLMTVTGQSLDVNMTNNQLDLTNEPIGVYFLQVNGENIRLIKN